MMCEMSTNTYLVGFLRLLDDKIHRRNKHVEKKILIQHHRRQQRRKKLVGGGDGGLAFWVRRVCLLLCSLYERVLVREDSEC